MDAIAAARVYHRHDHAQDSRGQGIHRPRRKTRPGLCLRPACFQRVGVSNHTVSELANRFFDGSVKSMVLSLIKTRQITSSDLDRASRCDRFPGDEINDGAPVVGSPDVVLAAGAARDRRLQAARTHGRPIVRSLRDLEYLFSQRAAARLSELFLPRLHLIQPWSRLAAANVADGHRAQADVGRILLAVWCIGATVSLIRWIERGHQLREHCANAKDCSDDRCRRCWVTTNTFD